MAVKVELVELVEAMAEVGVVQVGLELKLAWREGLGAKKVALPIFFA